MSGIRTFAADAAQHPDRQALAVNWLTSCGTMHDDDEHAAFVHVKPDDAQAGELVVVARAPGGGVDWQRFTMSAE